MAKRTGSQQLLPVREKKKTRRLEEKTVFVLECEGKIAIRKRPETGLLAGMWELPWMEGFFTEQAAVSQASAWGCGAEELLKTVQRKHIFTHIEWRMQGVFLRCRTQSPQFVWASPEELAQVYSLPTAFRCALGEGE